MATRSVILGKGGYAKIVAGVMPGVMLDKGDAVPEGVNVIIGVGDRDVRKRLYEQYKGRILGVLHPDASVARASHCYADCHVLAQASIQPGAHVGHNAIIYMGAVIDHDCYIGDHSFVGGNVTLCGNVTLGESCFIGAGSIIVPGVSLEAGTFIPAGSLVVGQDDVRRPRRVVQHRKTQIEAVSPNLAG